MQKLIAWVDRDLRHFNPRAAVALALFPGVIWLAAFGYHPLPLFLASAWALGWLALYLWRFVLLSRRIDAVYDRRTKLMLAKEYRTSESATAASNRRRKKGAKG